MKCALVIIDMQKAFFESEPLKTRQGGLVASCNELISSAHNHNIPIYTVRTIHSRSRDTWTLNMLDDDQGFLFPDEEKSSYVDGLDTDDSKEIIKTRDSSFWQTDLLSLLRSQGIETIVLCGVSTQLCITHTATDAYSANIRVELATDAIATHEPQLHEIFLKFLQSEFRMKLLSNSEITWK